MHLVGLTGGVGMGKSTVASFWARHAESVVDTDELARKLVAPGEPALEEIRDVFGEAVWTETGELDRKALAKAVFLEVGLRKQLEAILHPRIRAEWRRIVGDWRATGRPRGIVVIPLLYETGAESEFNQVVCVGCTPSTQASRLRARGWSTEEIRGRNAAQFAIEQKMDRADSVIWSEGAIGLCEEQARRLFPKLSNENRGEVSE